MKRLFFVRHGQSQANADNIYGAFDSPLTELGRKQAVEAAGKIEQTPDLCISSTQPRALETAQIITSKIEGCGEIVLSYGAREREYGVLEGSKFKMNGDDLDVSNDPTAETLKDLFVRAQEFLESLQGYDEETILVVSHGAFGRALYRVINGLTFDEPVDFIQNATPLQLI